MIPGKIGRLLKFSRKPRASGDDPDFFVIADNLLE